MKETHRISSGIKALDKTIEGGFKEKSINLLEGGPGTGKSIFAMQFLVAGINEEKENGIYITFEEEKESLMDNMKKFGWNLESLEKQEKLAILDISPEEVVGLVKKRAFGLKFEIAKKIKAKKIVIDSITAYSLLFEDGLKKREALEELFRALRELNCTSLLVAEREVTLDDTTILPDLVDFEVDSIISLYNIRKGDIRERALEVRKIRGTKSVSKIFPMKLGDKGIDIYPEEALF